MLAQPTPTLDLIDSLNLIEQKEKPTTPTPEQFDLIEGWENGDTTAFQRTVRS